MTSTRWIAVIAAIAVAVGVMVFVGGGDADCGTPTTAPCGPRDQPPIPPSMRP
jgi:hypothetical protein